MKQYLPMKPVKRGFKIWVRADSHNGYVCEFECYTGKRDNIIEVGLGGTVVTRLTRDLVGKSYHLYMDSLFSSVSLYRNLLASIVQGHYDLTDVTSLLTSRMQQNVA